MKTKRIFIISSILCLVCMWALAELLDSNDVAFTYDDGIDQLFCGYEFQISIDPAWPTIDDTVEVGTFGWWSNSCAPWYDSYQVVGNVIEIDFVHDYPPYGLCADVITPWGCTVDVGTLVSGVYEVDVYVNGFLCGTRSFIVFEELRPLFFPVIAK